MRKSGGNVCFNTSVRSHGELDGPSTWGKSSRTSEWNTTLSHKKKKANVSMSLLTYKVLSIYILNDLRLLAHTFNHNNLPLKCESINSWYPQAEVVSSTCTCTCTVVARGTNGTRHPNTLGQEDFRHKEPFQPLSNHVFHTIVGSPMEPGDYPH